MYEISIVQIVLFTFYLCVIGYYFGLIPSISDSWYRFKDRGIRWPFEAFTIAIGVCLWLYGDDFYNQPTRIVLGCSGFFLILVGMASEFSKSFIKPIHYTGAVLSIMLGFAAIWTQFGMWWCVGLLGSFGLLCFIFSRLKLSWYTTLIEVLAFYIIMGRLMIMQ